MFCTPTEARRGCVVVVKNLLLCHRFVVSILESVFFGRRRRQSLSLCCASKRVDRNVCRGSVVSVGLDAFIRGDTNLLSVRGGGGGAREEGEEEEEENLSKG